MQQNTGAVTMRRSVNHGAVSIDARRGTGRENPQESEAAAAVSGKSLVTAQRSSAEGLGMQLPEGVLAELNWIASEGTPSLSRHARIVLARNEGRSLSEIAKILDVDRATVRRWLLRYERRQTSASAC